jgi:hypothetical protein
LYEERSYVRRRDVAVGQVSATVGQKGLFATRAVADDARHGGPRPMNAMRLDAMRWKFAARGLVVLWPITLAAIAAQPAPSPSTPSQSTSSQSAPSQSAPSQSTSAQATSAQATPPSVQFPHDYRSWQHVKSIVIGPGHKSFAKRGGIHHYYANKEAVEGYRTGRFANGSIIVDEAVFTKDGTGQATGIVLEGESRFLDVMVKDDRLYSDTGGWGFEHFEGPEGQPATAQLDAKGRTECYECHAKRKDRDHVFSAIRVAKLAPR